MTLQEFYSTIDESYEAVLNRLRKEDRIAKYLGFFLSDPSFSELEKAFEINNPEAAFRAAHTMKGVASNLGFDKLAQESSNLTEDLRPLSFTGNSKILFSNVKNTYTKIIDHIKTFLESQA